MISKNKIFLLFCPLKIIYSKDVFTKNGYFIQLKLETTNLQTLELAKSKILTSLPFGNERIIITCSKINCHENGVLPAIKSGNSIGFNLQRLCKLKEKFLLNIIL